MTRSHPRVLEASAMERVGKVREVMGIYARDVEGRGPQITDARRAQTRLNRGVNMGRLVRNR